MFTILTMGKNVPLLSKCQTLREYMYFVDMVRKNNEISGNLEDAIEKAINQCMEENVLRDFLAKTQGGGNARDDIRLYI